MEDPKIRGKEKEIEGALLAHITEKAQVAGCHPLSIFVSCTAAVHEHHRLT